MKVLSSISYKNLKKISYLIIAFEIIYLSNKFSLVTKKYLQRINSNLLICICKYI